MVELAVGARGRTARSIRDIGHLDPSCRSERFERFDRQPNQRRQRPAPRQPVRGPFQSWPWTRSVQRSRCSAPERRDHRVWLSPTHRATLRLWARDRWAGVL